MSRRIIVTGSRTWTDEKRIREALHYYRVLFGRSATVVHGECPYGADRLAGLVAVEYGMSVETHPAQRDLHGKRAGFLRNAHMVELGADVCLAFIKANSKGATMCANLAEKAGITTQRFRED
ncbi:SLOG family protein [Actinoplanes sp. NPDC051470]|uniref:SLOG family protein n=1 Tax=Actinoplanes sp. NPDC051470 TaxID=3157224 RepID=UPI00343C9C29